MAYNSWTTGFFIAFFVTLQIIGVLLVTRREFDLRHLTTGYLSGTIFFIVTRNFWMGISAQMAG